MLCLSITAKMQRIREPWMQDSINNYNTITRDCNLTELFVVETTHWNMLFKYSKDNRQQDQKWMKMIESVLFSKHWVCL